MNGDTVSYIISLFKTIDIIRGPYDYLISKTLLDFSIYKQMDWPFFSGFRLAFASHEEMISNQRSYLERITKKKFYDEIRQNEYVYKTIKMMWHNGRNLGIKICVTRSKENGNNIYHDFHNSILCLLFLACMFDDKDMVYYIISLANFPINNAKNNLRRSILHHAIIEGKKEIVENLLKIPAINVNKLISSKYFHGTPLMLAVKKPEIFKLLIEHPSIDVNKLFRSDCHEKDKTTILHQAVTDKNIEIIKLLLNHKDIDVNKRVNNRSVLYYAITKNNIEVVKLLLNHKDIDVINGMGGISPLLHAVNLSHIDIAKLLINMPNINIYTSVESQELYAHSYEFRYDFSKEEDIDIYRRNLLSEHEDLVSLRWPILYNGYRYLKLNIYDILLYSTKDSAFFVQQYMRDIQHELDDDDSEQRRIEEEDNLEIDIVIALRENLHRERDEKIKSCKIKGENAYLKYLQDRDAFLKLVINKFDAKFDDNRHKRYVSEEIAPKVFPVSLPIKFDIVDDEQPKSRVKINRDNNKNFMNECREGTSFTVSTYKCNINYIGRFRTTPLIESIKAGNLRVTSILLSNPKIKMNLKDINGKNALHYLITLDNDGYRGSHINKDDLDNKNYIIHGPLKYLPIFLKSLTIEEIQDTFYSSSVERTKKLIHDILRERVSRTITEIDLFSNLPQLPGDVYKYIIARMMVPVTTWWPNFSRQRKSKIAIPLKNKVDNERPNWLMQDLLTKFVDDKKILETYDDPPPRITSLRRRHPVA